MRRKARPRASPPRCVLDSGGLSALCGTSQRARRWLRWLVEHDGSIVVPTPILVECTTGDASRDAEVNRILGVLARATAGLVAPDEVLARRAGRMRHRARVDDGIDALVAATAAREAAPCVVLTSDPDDLVRLLSEDSHVVVATV